MAWAAYKKGSLPIERLEDAITQVQGDEEVSEAQAFREVFEHWVLSQFDYGWTLSAPVKGREMTVGMVFGKDVGPFVYVGSMLWMPWASPRNRFEAIVNFVHRIRRERMIHWFAAEKDVKTFAEMCKLGIARRIGTSHEFDGKQAAYEATREDFLWAP